MSYWRFQLMTRADAIKVLASGPATDTSFADHVRANRRLLDVTTAEERAAAVAYNERAALERFQKVLRGEWPASGPIIVRAPEGR